jgi:hypothetical protein
MPGTDSLWKCRAVETVEKSNPGTFPPFPQRLGNPAKDAGFPTFPQETTAAGLIFKTAKPKTTAKPNTLDSSTESSKREGFVVFLRRAGFFQAGGAPGIISEGFNARRRSPRAGRQ